MHDEDFASASVSGDGSEFLGRLRLQVAFFARCILPAYQLPNMDLDQQQATAAHLNKRNQTDSLLVAHADYGV